MAYTATQIITMAQRQLVDIDDDSYLADCLTYVNEACRRFASETHCCQESATVNLTTNKVLFSTVLAAVTGYIETLWIARVQLNSGTRYSILPKMPLSESKDLLAVTTLVPTRYMVFGKTLFTDLHPSAVPSISLTLFASFVPTDLTSVDDELKIPDMWAQAIVKYVVFCCRIADRDAGLANGAFQEYEAIRVQASAFYLAQAEA